MSICDIKHALFDWLKSINRCLIKLYCHDYRHYSKDNWVTLLPSSISQHHADYFSIIELSDLHLFDDPNKLMNGVNTADTFE